MIKRYLLLMLWVCIASAMKAQVNDNICNAIPLVLNGASDCQTTEAATVEANEPTFNCSTPNNTVWYKYTPATGGSIKITMLKNTAATTDLNAWVHFFTATGTCPGITLTDAFTACNTHADLTTQDSVELASGNLVAGTTYYIMIDGYAGASGGFCIRLSNAPPPPACTTLLEPANNATNVSSPAADFTWMSVAGATGYDVALGTTNPPATLGNTPDTTVTITGLTANTTYYWTVYPTNAGVPASGCTVYSFTTGTSSGPANDAICDAIPLVLNGPGDCQNTETATVEANEPTNFSCSAPNNTVWYTYTPTVSGPVKITMSQNGGPVTSLDAWVSLFTATGTCPSLTLTEAFPGTCEEAALDIEDSVEIISQSLVAGTTYYIMIDGVADATGGYCIHLSDAPLPPPCTTLLAPLNNAVDVSVPAQLTWNSVAGADGYDVVLDTNNPPVTVLGNTPDTTVSITGLVYNTTYYWTINPTNSGVPATGCTVYSFTTGAAPAVPVNDVICDAIPLTLNGPSDCQTTESATVDANEPTFGCSDPNNTVWYTYTPTVSGPIKITMGQNASAASSLNAWVAFFTATGTCPALTLTEAFPSVCPQANLTTQDSVEIISQDLIAGTTYYIMIDGVVGATGGFCIHISDAPPPPVNDDCTGAIPLTSMPMPGTTIRATESLPANLCNGFTGDANDDVWYTVTANNAGDATVTVTPNGTFDAVVEAFTGTCGALTSLSCADDSVGGQSEILTLSNLTPGQIIYIRVFEFDAAGSEGTFTINSDGTALPVRLVNFRGEKAGTKNMLYWSTLSEQTNRGFELQRSADGENFSTLSFVQSKAFNGNSSTTLAYQFSDEKPLGSNNYYRLKQVDIDGKVTISNVVLIKGVRNNDLTLSAVYPNPVKSDLRVILSSPVVNQVKLIITDLAGKTVLQQNATVINSDNAISINVANLPSGSYMIKALCTNGCETAVSKFVKQ